MEVEERIRRFNQEVSDLKSSEQLVCKKPLGIDSCNFKNKDFVACVVLRRCEFAK